MIAALAPELSTEPDPGFWKRLFVYFSLGLLWTSTLFGLIMLPSIMQIGSEHSYFGERINGSAWIYLYIATALYTLIITVYLGIKGFSARYRVVLTFNLLLLIFYLVASGISLYLVLF